MKKSLPEVRRQRRKMAVRGPEGQMPPRPDRIGVPKIDRINTGVIMLIGGLLFALIIFGMIFPPDDNFFVMIFSKNNSSGSSPAVQPTLTTKSTLTLKPTLTPKPSPASQPTGTTTPAQTPVSESDSASGSLEILNLPIGGGASDGTKSVMVFSAKKTNQYSYYSSTLKTNQTEAAPPGKVFVLVDAEIKNIAAESFNASSASFSITDSGGYKYDPYTPYYGDDGLTIQQLYPNQISRGKVLFAIPSGSKGIKLQYKFRDTVKGPQLAAWPVT